MAKFEQEKQKLEEVNAKLDKQADSFLEKLQTSKWTGIGLVGAAVAAAFILLK